MIPNFATKKQLRTELPNFDKWGILDAIMLIVNDRLFSVEVNKHNNILIQGFWLHKSDKLAKYIFSIDTKHKVSYNAKNAEIIID